MIAVFDPPLSAAVIHLTCLGRKAYSRKHDDYSKIFIYVFTCIFNANDIQKKPVKIYHTKHRAKWSGKLMSSLRIF